MPRPTAVVNPMKNNDEKHRGVTGLDNIGNTCFMNCIIQVLINTTAVRDYFLGSELREDLNTDNVLGSGGKLALQFAALTRKLWSGKEYSINPSMLKQLIAKKASQFTGFAQHDSQEFLAFLLDGLHEDLNRIRSKPYIEHTSLDHLSDVEAAAIAWERYKARNDSFIVDHFQGQFRSKLFCPVCEKVSVTFDPYMYVSVPIPKKTVEICVMVFCRKENSTPIKVAVSLPKQCTLREITDELSPLIGIPAQNMKFIKLNETTQTRGNLLVEHSNINVTSDTVLFCFEVDTVADKDDDLVHLCCMQRTLKPTFIPEVCAHCNKTTEDTKSKMKRCTRCLKVGYCNGECQATHWKTKHKHACKSNPIPVGMPFLVSLPKSKLTYQNLVYEMNRYAQYSVNVFQPPVSQKSPSTENMAGGDNNLADGAEDPDHGASFYIKPVDSYGYGINNMARIQDQGDELLDIKCTYLAIDWKNDDRLYNHVLVDEKIKMEMEIHESCENRPSDKNEPVSLMKCLQLFTKPEVLSPEEAWYCPTCKEHREAEKEMVLWSLPDVLIIQLKRFSFRNNLWRDKINDLITYPISGLDMSGFSAGPTSDRPPIYDLYGVANHHGGLLGGHYTAYARLLTEDNLTHTDWRLMNDSRVSYVQTESSVVTASAYVLFYKRRQPTIVSPQQPIIDKQITASITQSGQDMEIDDTKNGSGMVNRFDDDINNDDVQQDKSHKVNADQINGEAVEINQHQQPLFWSSRIEDTGQQPHESQGKKGRSKIQELGQSQSSSDYEVIQSDPENEEEESNKTHLLKAANSETADNPAVSNLGYTDMDEMD